MNDSKTTRVDALETYELLRATHTLLRMAFGAIALSAAPKSQKEADAIQKPFQSVFKTIEENAKRFAELADSLKETESACAD